MTDNIKDYALLDNLNIVKNIVVFSVDYSDEDANIFAINTGYAKAISCLTYGKPYIGDTWDDINKSWIESVTRIVEKETPTE